MKSSIGILICVFLVGAISFLVWRMVFESRYRNQSSKDALIEIYENLQLEDPKQRTIEVYERFKTDRTNFRKDNGVNTWEVGMPFEFGSSDWILYLQFADKGDLSAVIIRTSDGIFRRPAECPDDKGIFIAPTSPENDG